MRRLATLALIAVTALTAAPSLAGDVAASAPRDVSVTIYRAPYRNGGTIQLNYLGGFAVITETRVVSLPAGESELRFEGVVDGIIPESAIVSGLPGGVIEKNRNAALLSPSALARATVGKSLTLKRTDRKTGKTRLVPATLVSAGPDGVVFKTAEGEEALRCSGNPETFSYSRSGSGLYATPTLSVKTRAKKPITTTVTLTYIAEGFDWSANYTAHINPDGKTMDIGGWMTLANGNTVSLSNARTQIVAGGLNREYVNRYVGNEAQVVAKCWPMQRTHQIPLKPDRPYQLVSPYMGEDYESYEDVVVTAQRSAEKGMIPPPPAPMMMAPPPPPPPPPPPEQLGDLKLYRVPQRTTVAAQQMKQSRLVEQKGVPFDRIYTQTFSAQGYGDRPQTWQAIALVRTKNDKEHKLGLPLPAGSFVVEQDHWGRTMLVGQPSLSDTAEGEKIELVLGDAPDITATRRTLRRNPKANDPQPETLSGDMLALWQGGASIEEFALSNASDQPVRFELKLQTWGTTKVRRATLPVEKQDGQPIFFIDIPANSVIRLQYTVDKN
ncbi:DUF4139 domain-containing protein [Novosphingobium sp.]|uniref:DUF4139 domain-containing protein n=1 Tax=Novosphingobium sp. TaxID=1874826 RepID=UPI0035AE7D8A